MKHIIKLFLVFILFADTTVCKIPESQVVLENTLKKTQSGKMLLVEDDFPVLKNILKYMTYEINEVTQNKDSAQINVTIKTINFQKHMSEYFYNILTLSNKNLADENLEKNAKKFFLDLLEKENLNYIEKKIIVHMVKENEKWDIVNRNELIDTLIGDLSKLKKGKEFFKTSTKGDT